MYLISQMTKIASHQQLADALDAAIAGAAVASKLGDLPVQDLFIEIAGLAQGEIGLRHNYVTGKDLGQISKAEYK